jgi:hypothetical protein
MSRLFFATFAWAVVFSALATANDGNKVPCGNRVRDFYSRAQQVKQMQAMEDALEHGFSDSKVRAELLYQLALAAWRADSVEFYRKCERSLNGSLRADPFHLRARELALVQAVRGVERGYARALASAMRHARELLQHPETQNDPQRLSTVLATNQWLENKLNGRKALQFIARMPLSAEQLPNLFLEQTQSLASDFAKALWEVGDSSPEVLERFVGESVLDVLEKGIELEGQRLTALMLLGKVDRAIEEYRHFLEMLSVGMEPGPEQDGSFLVVPALELSRKFESFRDNDRLQEWSLQAAKVWTQGPGETVDWMDLLLAGRLSSDPEVSRTLWRTTRHAFGQSKQANSPLSKASNDQVLSYLDSLLGENPQSL